MHEEQHEDRCSVGSMDPAQPDGSVVFGKASHGLSEAGRFDASADGVSEAALMDSGA
ncbi:hypothetical protein [Streptomyces sp. NPDC059142]|uniref:hypothetical protein n=1 Tax=Streptomyces sp. NPDC059142 TaxID=3346739 RepID=UPI00369FA812